MPAAPRRTRRRLSLIAACAVAALGVLAALPTSPASAAPTTSDPYGGSIFTDLSMGNTAEDVGDIWIKRTTNDAGTGEALLVTVYVDDPGEISESSVCIKDTPFTERELGEGGCTGTLVQQGASGSSAEYDIDLGTDFAGETLYAQIHVTLTERAARRHRLRWVDARQALLRQQRGAAARRHRVRDVPGGHDPRRRW